jgi:hypothetical protein
MTPKSGIRFSDKVMRNAKIANALAAWDVTP